MTWHFVPVFVFEINFDFLALASPTKSHEELWVSCLNLSKYKCWGGWWRTDKFDPIASHQVSRTFLTSWISWHRQDRACDFNPFQIHSKSTRCISISSCNWHKTKPASAAGKLMLNVTLGSLYKGTRLFRYHSKLSHQPCVTNLFPNNHVCQTSCSTACLKHSCARRLALRWQTDILWWMFHTSYSDSGFTHDFAWICLISLWPKGPLQLGHVPSISWPRMTS